MLSASGAPLRRGAIVAWGPETTRTGAFAGLIKNPASLDRDDCRQAKESCRQLARRINLLEREGIRTLIVSDENLLGSMRENLLHGRLYP